jgi:hypothetical protein
VFFALVTQLWTKLSLSLSEGCLRIAGLSQSMIHEESCRGNDAI